MDWTRRPLDLRRLRQFVAVAETRHFGRAAKLLGMAQPPLSQQIAKLETEVGAALFTRGRAGAERVALTDAGRSLLPLAHRLLADSHIAVETARAAARGERGTLRIAFVASLAASPLPRLLRDYRRQCPEVRLILREMTTTPMLDALTAGAVDIGFGREVAPAPGIVAVRCWDEAIMAVLPDDHPLAGSGRLDLSRLRGEPFVLPPRSAGAAFVDRLKATCTAAGFAPTIAQEAVEWPTVLALVAAGVGVTLAPSSATATMPTGLVALPFAHAEASTSVSLCWSSSAASEVLERFNTWLMAKLRP